MAPPKLVLLNRCFDGPATPTASAFAFGRGDDARHGFMDTDYDEGDVLDELLLDTAARELPRRQTAMPSAVSVPDDSASTCSSTTVADDDSDGGIDNGDSCSMTSVSASGSSCAGGGRRRRRRRNPGRVPAVAAACGTSDAGTDPLGHHVAATQSKPKPPKRTGQTKKEPNSGGRKGGKRKGPKPSLVSAAARSRHPTLQIGLDLDVEMQLKSKVRGDICLTLVLEEAQNVAPRASPEIRRNAAGRFVAYDGWEDVEDGAKTAKGATAKGGRAGKDARSDADDVEEIEVTRIKRQRPGPSQTRELCHLRVGRLNLTRRWWMDGYDMISHIPPPVVAGVAVTMPVAGFAAGWVAAHWAGYWPW